MKHFENIPLFAVAVYGVLRIWQKLEFCIYGAIQHRIVDDIITWVWLILMALVYFKAYQDGKTDGYNDKRGEDNKE